MIVLKCKMCGGALAPEEGASTVRCEYCESVQTVPKADDEKKLLLFERAEKLRKQCEFDKAAGVYESVLADFREEAEAYWGLLLCKYGIEYVDDPATGKKIPTCHRSGYESVLEDANLELALENADVIAQKVYREEAKQFERIRKGILEVSSGEDPYDIFICYKETDENGDRTLDSVLAQDLYTALTDKGYRVFFSRITLGSKLGVDYEPYIFAALNSAKVMLAVGTAYEYYNAVWVKNEWSRYLRICAADPGNKHLIPCYKNLDPEEDLPREFKHLQGADLGKMGAVQDILFNMEKYIPLKKESSSPVSVANPTVDSYLKRAFLFLEDEEWQQADEYCEKALDIDPECAEAYLGKLLCELRVKSRKELASCDAPFDGQSAYRKTIRFADEALKNALEQANAAVSERLRREEQHRLETQYEQASEMMESASSEDDCIRAKSAFEALGDYRDAPTMCERCEEMRQELIAEARNREECRKAEEILKNAITQEKFEQGIRLLSELGDFAPAAELKAKYEEAWKTRGERAAEVWQKYNELRNKVLESSAQIDAKRELAQSLNSDVLAKKAVLSMVRSKNERVAGLEKELENAEKQSRAAQRSLSSAGMFAFSKKKELGERAKQTDARVKQIAAEIYLIKTDLIKLPKEAALQEEMESNDQNFKKLLAEARDMSDQLEPLKKELKILARSVDDRQVLAALMQDAAVLPMLAGEDFFEKRMKRDEELKQVLLSSESFIKASKHVQNALVGTKKLDREAIYYQACQAMDHAKSLDDIRWARVEFGLLCSYRDSDQRRSKCEKMLAKNSIG
ncbi:MAG: TIR domain-containing protein [Ruminococcaceae bacterium]|nr:TIR domain-containing protein [Oscillospiraceae bacterium]